MPAYKHLGSWIEIGGAQVKDARHKESQGMAAYVPISRRVFGNAFVRLWLKVHFMHSLIMSRCLFNACVRLPAASMVKRLNRTHMKVLRRISGCINGVDTEKGNVSNVTVRRLVGEPSVCCLLAMSRLRYA